MNIVRDTTEDSKLYMRLIPASRTVPFVSKAANTLGQDSRTINGRA